MPSYSVNLMNLIIIMIGLLVFFLLYLTNAYSKFALKLAAPGFLVENKFKSSLVPIKLQRLKDFCGVWVAKMKPYYFFAVGDSMGTPHFLTGSGLNTTWRIVQQLKVAVETESIQLISFSTKASILLDKMLAAGAQLCHDFNEKKS